MEDIVEEPPVPNGPGLGVPQHHVGHKDFSPGDLAEAVLLYFLRSLSPEQMLGVRLHVLLCRKQRVKHDSYIATRLQAAIKLIMQKLGLLTDGLRERKIRKAAPLPVVKQGSQSGVEDGGLSQVTLGTKK